MKSFILSTLVLPCFFCSSAYSQLSDSLNLRQLYEQETIYLQGKDYIKGDQRTRLKYITIEKEFTFSKEAYPEFLLSAQDHKSAVRSFYLSLGLYIGSILLLADKKDGALIPFAASMVAYGYGVHYRNKSEREFHHALWSRNRDALLEGSSDITLLSNRYENETIHLSKGRYIKGDQKISLRPQTFEKEFAVSEDGLKEYKLSVQEQQKARPSAFLGLGLVISFFVLASHHQSTAAWIALGGAAITIPISNHHLFKSQNRLRKAIWLRNRDVLITGH